MTGFADMISESAEEKAFMDQQREGPDEGAELVDADAPEPQPQEPPGDDGAQEYPREEPAPEPPAEGQEEEDEDAAADENGRVPFGALRKERDRRQALERQYRMMEDRVNRIMGALAQNPQVFQQPQAAPQEPQEQIPDKDKDPLGYMLHTVESLQKRIEEQHRQEEARTAFQTFTAELRHEEQAFAQEVPDYPHAVQYAIQHRSQELELQGYAPQQIQHAIAQDIRFLRQQARQTGRTFPELAYEVARLRGYSPRQAQAIAQGQDPGAPQGQPQAPARPRQPNGQFAPPAGAQAGQRQIQELDRRRREAGTSLSSAGGNPGGGVTFRDLEHLSDDEFDKHFMRLYGNT